MPNPPSTDALANLLGALDGCRVCATVQGTPVHGPAVKSRVLLLGQAPGPREASFGRPFAWTAGRTLFAWFQGALGCTEETFRERVYIAAVARCFPGKAKGGGDRRPNPLEISSCERWLTQEVALLKPELVLPVGTLAIERVLGHKGPLADVVGRTYLVNFLGARVQAIPLPHPSGASTWHRMEPGRSLLARALEVLASNSVLRETLGGAGTPAGENPDR